MTAKLIHFHVKRYRSLLDVKIDIPNDQPLVICGENNIGKTNFLRALNLFFNHFHNDNLFKPHEDIPHHIYYGSRGNRTSSELTAKIEIDGETTTIKTTFKFDGTIIYKINNKQCTNKDALETLSKFDFIFIESHNIQLPQLISIILEKEGLVGLDAKRSKQTKPLEKLQEFIELSKTAISDIEKEINLCFKDLTDFDGILKDKEVKINFAEFEKLRDVVKTMTSITLHDGNNHGIASKGSGAQRAVFLALMQYVSQNSKKNVIWGIDEPEAFLQPKLQKKVNQVFQKLLIEKKQPIIITTHSPNFITLKDLKHTHLFKGEITEKKYVRRQDEVFFQIDTNIVSTKSGFEKAMLIREHLGIQRNDGWEVFPYNIMVEGEEDKKYLTLLLESLDLPCPNILFSGGASKIAGCLQFYNTYAEDLDYKPHFLCLFDNDKEGREQENKTSQAKCKNIKIDKVILPNIDGKTHTQAPNLDWEIEDYIPTEILFKEINSIIKKAGYKQINSKQRREYLEPLHNKRQILEYSQAVCEQNNLDKKPLFLDAPERKMQLCYLVCSNSNLEDLRRAIKEPQKKCLKRICEMNI